MPACAQSVQQSAAYRFGRFLHGICHNIIFSSKCIRINFRTSAFVTALHRLGGPLVYLACPQTAAKSASFCRTDCLAIRFCCQPSVLMLQHGRSRGVVDACSAALVAVLLSLAGVCQAWLHSVRLAKLPVEKPVVLCVSATVSSSCNSCQVHSVYGGHRLHVHFSGCPRTSHDARQSLQVDKPAPRSVCNMSKHLLTTCLSTPACGCLTGGTTDVGGCANTSSLSSHPAACCSAKPSPTACSNTHTQTPGKVVTPQGATLVEARCCRCCCCNRVRVVQHR